MINKIFHPFLSGYHVHKPLNIWFIANQANTLKRAPQQKQHIVTNVPLWVSHTCDWGSTKYFPLLFPIIPGPEEAAMGGADWEGPGQTPRLLLCPAGRACHRGAGHADGGSMWLPDAPGQLHQPSGGTHRYRPHLGQDAQLQGGWVREGVGGGGGF